MLRIDDVRRALVVVAHCDDAEWMFGGTVARLVDGGATVSYVVTTDGANGGIDPAVPATELAGVRAAEQRAAAEALGVDDVMFLGYRDDELTVTVPLKRDLVRQIRRRRPELVLTWMPYRTLDVPLDWGHGDHIATGEATVQAVYPEALMPRIHPELAGEGLSAHAATEIWVPATTDADVYVDVAAVVQRKMDAIWCMTSQNGEADGNREWMFEHRVAPAMREAGSRIGTPFAERFRRISVSGSSA